jgi:hypothetical protein
MVDPRRTGRNVMRARGLFAAFCAGALIAGLVVSSIAEVNRVAAERSTDDLRTAQSLSRFLDQEGFK